MIRLLADSPKVKKLHLLAHSRGPDVLLSALRELALEVFISGRSFNVSEARERGSLDPYDRNNLWCLDLARTEVGPERRPRVAVLLVDGERENPLDRLGLLDHFVENAQQADLLVEEIVLRLESTLETAPFPIATATAIVKQTGGPEQQLEFSVALTVGRAEGNDVILSDGRTSRQHLKLEPRVDGLHLSNLSRRQGATLLDGLELDPGSAVWMTYGQTIRLVDGTTVTVSSRL